MQNPPDRKPDPPAPPERKAVEGREEDKSGTAGKDSPVPEKWLSSLDDLFLFDPNFESCW